MSSRNRIWLAFLATLTIGLGGCSGSGGGGATEVISTDPEVQAKEAEKLMEKSDEEMKKSMDISGQAGDLPEGDLPTFQMPKKGQ